MPQPHDIQPYVHIPLKTWCEEVAGPQDRVTHRNSWWPWKPGAWHHFGPPDYSNDNAEVHRYSGTVTPSEDGFPNQAINNFALRTQDSFVALLSNAYVLKDNFAPDRYLVLLAEGIAPLEGYHTTPIAEACAKGHGEQITLMVNNRPAATYWHRRIQQTAPTEPEAVLMCHPWMNNYCHFLLELVPRLSCFDDFPELRKLPVIVPNYPAGSWQHELLHGLANGLQMRPQTASQTCYERLVLPTMSPLGGYSAEQLAFVSQRIKNTLSVTASAPNRRLLISRADAKTRQICNEDALYAELQPYGFERHVLSGMPISEQVRLFAESELVVAPHGAGCVNLVFMQSGTTLIELVPATYKHPIYWMLAKLNGLRYARLITETRQGDQLNANISEVLDLTQRILR